MKSEMKKYPQSSRLLQFSEQILGAKVIDRPNRFLVIAKLGESEIPVHLHDPGRLKELIFPKNDILIRQVSGLKTQYSILAARGEDGWVFLDTRFHNLLAIKILGEPSQKEVKLGNKRIDLKYGDILVEVKGCNLLIDGGCYFPDAPTKRGSEQVEELIRYTKNGGSAKVIFLCFRKKANFVSINREMDPRLYHAFTQAIESGIEVEAHKIYFSRNSLFYAGPIDFLISRDH